MHFERAHALRAHVPTNFKRCRFCFVQSFANDFSQILQFSLQTATVFFVFYAVIKQHFIPMCIIPRIWHNVLLTAILRHI